MFKQQAPKPRFMPGLSGIMPLSRMSLRPAHGFHFDGEGGGGDEPDDDPADPEKGKGKGEGEKPVLTQKQFDEALQKRLASEQRKWDREFGTKLNSELSNKLKERDEADKKAGKDTIPRAEFDNLKSQLENDHKQTIDGLMTKIGSLLGHQKQAAILTGAAPHKPVNGHAVTKMAADHISFDDEGKMIVLNKEGKARYGQDGNYLSVDTFMVEFAKENPYLFEASGASGSGGKAGNKPAGPDTKNLSSTEKIAMGLRKK